MSRMTPRDAAIVAEVAEGKFYLREQLQVLFFKHIRGPQKAQERLRKLYQRKELKRRRVGSQGGYVYYADKWSEKYGHWLALNWVKVALVSQAKSWQKVAVFKREYVFQGLRADALVAIDNTVRKSRQVFFVEADNGTNKFTDKYSKVAEELEFSLERPWWYGDGFPPVLVVTNRPGRVWEAVEGSAVRYIVATLEDIRRDIYGRLSRPGAAHSRQIV